MALPKLPPDVEKAEADAKSVWNTITDKRRTWVAVLVLMGISLVLGMMLRGCVP